MLQWGGCLRGDHGSTPEEEALTAKQAQERLGEFKRDPIISIYDLSMEAIWQLD